MIRAFYRSAKAEGAPAPFETLTLKVFYPASFSDTPQERNTGVIPADTTHAPYPIVIFFPGVNVGIESYTWLAVELAKRNIVTVLFAWIAEDFPGSIALTPGMDLAYLKPDTYGSGPSANALPALLAEIDRINQKSVLAGLVDTNRIYLGGHSAGGTMALLNANRDWFPQVRGAFAYGAHSGVSTMLGFPPATVLKLPDTPMLIVGGTRDGVIESSSHRYALDGKSTPTLLLERTFHEGAQKDSALIILADANHFLIAHPHDDTTGRGFLEQPGFGDQAAQRALFIELVTTFIAKNNIDSLRAIASDSVLVSTCLTK